MDFPRNLRYRRQVLGLTQAEFAVKLEISQSTLEKWEAGTNTPLQVTIEGVMARVEKMKTNKKKK